MVSALNLLIRTASRAKAWSRLIHEDAHSTSDLKFKLRRYTKAASDAAIEAGDHTRPPFRLTLSIF